MTTAFPPRKHRIAVAVFFFIAGFTFASWASRIPHIQASLKLNEAQLGSVLFALPVGLMVSLLIAGALITKLGSRKVLLIAACTYSIVLVLLGLAGSIMQLVICLFIFGMAGNLFNISVNTQAVSVEKLYSRSIMAGFHGIWSLAGFSGAAVGTLMVSMHLQPWQHFIIICCIGITNTFLFANQLIAHTSSSSNQPAFAWPDKTILHFGIIAFGCLVCEGTMFDWSGVYFKKVVHAPLQLTTLGYAAFMGCMAAGRFVADKVVMKIGSKKVLQYSGVVIAAGLALAVIFPTVTMATVGFMLVGFGVSSVVPIVYSRAGQSKTLNAGQALAAVSTVGFAGFLIGPPMIGFVAEASSLRWSFAVIALIGLLTSVMSGKLPKSE